jgi:hypothetical protein
LRATRVRVTQKVRSNVAARATITVIGKKRKVVARRNVRLVANRTRTQRLRVSRARLRGATRVRVRVVVKDGARHTRTSSHLVRVPRVRR